MKKLLPTIILLLSFSFALAQEEGTVKTDSTSGDIIKSGWIPGPLPTVSYDSDLGFQYGLLLKLFYYGDEGARYPEYDHLIYMEWSRYTKGSGINRIAFDSKTLIPGIRLVADMGYYTEKALDFYGFNGYEAAYHSSWEDMDSDEYLSRLFYKHSRKLFRFKLDFQGKLAGKNLLWYAGLNISNFKIDQVDFEGLNKKLPEEKQLPDTSIYQNYVDWGIIAEDEAKGGNYNYLSAGLVWDSRDNEANPMKGMWTEAVVRAAPSFLGNGDYANLKLAITHRQYFTIIPRNLSFAYRLGYQTTLAGKSAFYTQPLMAFSFYRGMLASGLGGGKTLRGVNRNRVVGESIAYANLEFRWKFAHFEMLNQNIYLALNGFLDAGKTLQPFDYNIDLNDINFDPDNNGGTKTDFFDQDSDSFHKSTGAGFRIAMNQNFIVALDYGFSLDGRDGDTGTYIGLDYLF